MVHDESFKMLVGHYLKDGFCCPVCGGDTYWIKEARRLLICRKCRKEISPLGNTMFGRSHIPLKKWLELIRLICCSPERVITAKTVFEELDLGSYRTAWEAMNKVRYAISLNEPQKRLNGVIEFDEIVITGYGSDYHKVSILGALELEGEKRLSLQMIKNPDEMNIKDYFKRRFSENIKVITSPDKLYIRNWLELNRISQMSSFSYYGGDFMNLHIILQDIRFGLKNGHHSVSEKYMQRNLDEYVFIFNHNNDREEAYRIVLKYMLNTKITDYRKLEKRKRSVFSIIRG